MVVVVEDPIDLVVAEEDMVVAMDKEVEEVMVANNVVATVATLTQKFQQSHPTQLM